MASPAQPAHPGNLANWLVQARSGSGDALGRLLDSYRNYLLMVANAELETELQSKAGASDLVQETFLQAQQNFNRFQGDSGAELVAWLRQILLNNLANFSRRYRATAKRQVACEVALDGNPGPHLTDSHPTPSTAAADDERDQALEKAIGQLPEHYRLVILWRNFDCLSFEEIGRCLDRSAEAARKLWTRALEELATILEPAHDPG